MAFGKPTVSSGRNPEQLKTTVNEKPDKDPGYGQIDMFGWSSNRPGVTGQQRAVLYGQYWRGKMLGSLSSSEFGRFIELVERRGIDPNTAPDIPKELFSNG